MTSLYDGILSVFLDRSKRELTDTELNEALVKDGINCGIDVVRRHVDCLRPGIFQLTKNHDESLIIRVEPEIEICADFLDACCRAPSNRCNKLHICRHLGRCERSNCHFPHDFTRGQNQYIVNQHKCQHVSPLLLVRFLREKSRVQRPPNRRPFPKPKFNPGGNSFPLRATPSLTNLNSTTSPGALDIPNDVSDRQVDLSLLSMKKNNEITRSDIQLFLTDLRIPIDKLGDENDDDYFRRMTITLKQSIDVDRLLHTPVRKYNDVDMKFKRTKLTIDSSSFLLKISINDEKEKIELSQLQTYIDQLVNRHSIESLIDLSTDSEQILRIQCTGNIDFNRICQKNAARPQISGKDITVIQIYQCDSVTVNYSDQQSINEFDIKFIFKAFLPKIFSYKFPSPTYAEVEFLDSNGCKECLSVKDRIEKSYEIIITPFFDNVDENSIDTRSTTSNEHDIQTRRTTITLRPDWALILNHRIFKEKYTDFIRDKLRGEVQIKNNEITYMADFPKRFMDTRSDLILLNITAEFMRQFRCETFENLDQDQLDILRKHGNTIAYTRLQHDEYLMAAESSNISALKQELFPQTNSPRIEPAITSEPVMSTSTTPKTPMVTPVTAKTPTDTPVTAKTPTDTPVTAKSPMVTPVTAKTSMGTSDRLKSSMAVSTTSTDVHVIGQIDQRNMFSIKRFENDLKEYIQRKFQVKFACKQMRDNIRLEVNGEAKSVRNAVESIAQLFSSLCTKKFNDQSDEFWTIIDEAEDVINHHFELSGMICLAERISSNTIVIHHFDQQQQPFGLDEEEIERFIKDRFQSVRINFNSRVNPRRLVNNIQDLFEHIRQRKDHLQDICCAEQSMIIYLFGLPKLVKSYRNEFEKIGQQQETQPCRITLSEDQLNYLTHVAKTEMNKLQKYYQSVGCDVSLTRLRQNCEIVAPLHLHDEIKAKIQELAHIRRTTFVKSSPALDVLLKKEPDRLISLVKSKCYLDKRIESSREFISIPRARIIDVDDAMQSTASGRSDEPFTMNFGHSTVTIMTGDLIEQKVDAVVLSLASGRLCQEVISRAGTRTQEEFDRLRSEEEFPGITSGGKLPCKTIIWIPWQHVKLDASQIATALSTFVAISFAYAEQCKSLAFPAVGCGELGFDPSVIAKSMLFELRTQLKTLKSKMNVSIVLLPEQKHVYDAFVQCLKSIENIDLSVTAKVPSTKKDDQSSILFEKRTVTFILIGSNDHDLIECKQMIEEEIQLHSTKKQITKTELLDWPQTAIDKYYDYCLKLRVIPTINLETATLELYGAKDEVNRADRYFYELISEVIDDQRIRAISRGIIWSVEIRRDSDRWEPYSYRLNGIIEDANKKKRPYVEFNNEKNDLCRIDFSTMRETIQLDSRRVRRIDEDSPIPATWTKSNENCVRVALSSSSNEFQQVRYQFDRTMVGKYSQIIRIERIQNERWYKQYAAHREDFRRRYKDLDERQLFHGCSSVSADQIITSCFNRTFAGINGVLYGHGVYFHTQARYSHQYASKNYAGERTMFIARVLIGKTCVGNNSMRVPPTGYDTTTDEKDIFVVYHDAGAYAEYLITYKGE